MVLYLTLALATVVSYLVCFSSVNDVSTVYRDVCIDSSAFAMG